VPELEKSLNIQMGPLIAEEYNRHIIRNVVSLFNLCAAFP